MKKRLRKLARAIRSEVKEQNGVAIANSLLVRVSKNERRHELIRLPGRVMALECGAGKRVAKFSSPQRDCVPRLLRPIPTPVAIHGEVSSHHRDHAGPALFQELCTFRETRRAARRRGIAAIGESMHTNVINAGRLSRIGQSNHVKVVAMHTAFGDEAKQMQTVAARSGQSGL